MRELTALRYDDQFSEFDLSKTAPCDDRLMTKLTLDDYDWMNYKFETIFPTKAQGILKVLVEYCGSTVSDMTVEQTVDGHKFIHKIRFDTDIFVVFIKDFMTKHIAQWDSTYAFSGSEEAIAFFNKILENRSEYEIEEIRV